MKIKRMIGLLLIFSMIVPLLSLGEMVAYAYDQKEFVVESVTLYKIYDRNRNMQQRRILITGKYLKDATVGIYTSEGYRALTNRINNEETLLQFNLTSDELGKQLRIGSINIDLDEDLMPTLTGISRKVENEHGTLVLEGTNLLNIAQERDIKAYYEQEGAYNRIEDYHFDNNSSVSIQGLTGSLGLQNVIFEKEKTKNYTFNEKNKDVPVKVTITYTYKDQFSFYQNINVSNLEMRPNRGMIGDTIFFEAPFNNSPTDLQEYDVFFLKEIDGTDLYSLKNKGKNRRFQQNVNGKSILTVEVPDIQVGEYYVVLTNVTDGKDPMKAVTKEKIIGNSPNYEKFTVVDGSIKSKIIDIQPNRGPDTGSVTTITGQFFGTLNIPEFRQKEEDTQIKPIIKVNDPTTLEVNYGPGKYNDIDIKNATRNINVLIGGKAIFLEKDGKPNVSFNSDIDKMTIKTSQVTDAEVKPIKDVVVETTTTFTKTNGETIVIRERAELKNGYTYVASKLKPEIKSVVPEKIQVAKANGEYKIPENRMVAIHGENFMIHKYTNSDGKEVIRYPVVELGTDIILDKNIDNKIEINIIDKNGNILDGTWNSEIGSKILLILPEGKTVKNLGKTYVKVTNPIRNSEEYGLSDQKTDFVEFILPNLDKIPVITNVNPDTVSVDGGELVTIDGTNFDKDVKLFLDGEEIKGLKRREDGKEIKFTAPKGREGETQIQVMNPQGGMDTRPFFYVRTFTNPKIVDFSPKRGNTGTIVVIKGQNFLKPDPTATEDSAYRLIGTRVLLGGIELNDYNRDPVTKRIKVRDFSPNEKLFIPENNNVKVADYYRGILLKDKETGKFYTVDIMPNGKIILSDGATNTYSVEFKDSKIVANKEGGKIHPLTINTDNIIIEKADSQDTFEPVILKLCTVYKVENGEIVGNKINVIDRDTIYFKVPVLGAPGFYDLTVINPDTKKDSRVGKAGFEYITLPDLKPEITQIVPNEGSVEGGYFIDIIGRDFETDLANKPRVYINGVEVPAKDTNVSIDGKTITVVVPKYPGDLREEKGTDRWPVPVVVVNPDGSTASSEKGFYYVVPSSSPKISKIIPQTGTAAGGDIVEITGFDFRFFEPYEDANRNQIYDEGEKWNDINEDGIWNDLLDSALSKEERDELAEKTSINHPLFDYCYSSNILPKIYFGNTQAKIVEFSRGYIKVITPKGSAGKVDVFVSNNDGGISNKVPFVYEATTVKIDSVVPNEGKKQGGDRVEIHGSGFATTEMDIYTEEYVDGKSQYNTKNMPLVKFGNVSNRNIDRDKPNGGRIDSNRATVELSGGLRAEFNGVDEKVVLTVEQGNKIYKKEILGYDNTVKYISINELKNNGEYCPGNELIRIEVKDRRFIVERGYSKDVKYLNSTQITVETPSYHTVGKVPIFVINPDGGTGEAGFEYKNPDSHPVITNITKEGRDPIEEYRKEINGKARIVKVNSKGGNIIGVLGTDFREGAIIKISNILTIPEKDIDYGLPNKLTFKIPAVPDSEVGKLHRLIVQNPDGGTATSDKNIPPIFIEFTKGESNPSIVSIEPDRGPATGGTKVKITGNDFRETMEGYEGEKLKVYFGETEVEYRNIKFIDYKTIEVIVPGSKVLGQVQVRVENPDSSTTQGNVNFNYISRPTIEGVSPNRLFSNDTKTEVTITGKMFLPSAKVVVGGKIVDKKDLKKDMQIMGEGILGVDAQGKNREVAVVGGMEAATVKVENENTIKVTFKEAKELENVNLIIINPDGGISDPYDKFRYEKPIPLKPIVLEGIPGYESTVKLIWSKSDEDILNKATRYEIYGKKSGDRDYTFIGDTDEAEFLVKGLEPNTEYIFMVRALNEHGAAIDFATVKVRTLSIREDEKLKEKEEKLKEEEKKLKEKGKEEVIEGNMVKILGTDDLLGGIGTIDFSLAKYKKYDKFTVSIPISMARSDSRLTIKDGTFSLILNPRDLYTLEVSKKDSGNKDAYIRIQFERDVERHLPRGKKASSKSYDIYFDYQYGKETLEIKNMLKNGKLFIEYDSIAYPNRKDFYLARLDEKTGNYVFVTKGNSTDINKSGKYILLSNR